MHTFHANLLFRMTLAFGSRPMAVTERRAIVFAPHPDDETLGCGGMIALKRAQGIPVDVLFLTDGRNAHAQALAVEDVTADRRREALAALRVLGVAADAVHFLDAPDGGLADLAGAARQRLIDRLVEHLRACAAQEVYLPHRKDGHRDHEAAYILIQEAVGRSGLVLDVFEYPIWLFWRMPPLFALGWKWADVAGALCVAIGPVQEQKAEAITAYRSQLTEAILPAGFLARFACSSELYFHVPPLRRS